MRAGQTNVSQLELAIDAPAQTLPANGERPIESNPALCYTAGYLPVIQADRLQRTLKASMSWTRERIRMYGREIEVPRQVAWCGDAGVSYRYSGLPHTAQGWPAQLLALRDRLEQTLDRRFNFALLNLYCDGSEYMGWHRDDEPGAGDLVASISLGASRRFLMRRPQDARSCRLDLEHGSLLVFPGSIRHSLPRCSSAGERMNITFRSISMDVPN